MRPRALASVDVPLEALAARIRRSSRFRIAWQWFVTTWFYGVAWDWCFCLISHARPLAWVGCLTDTD